MLTCISIRFSDGSISEISEEVAEMCEKIVKESLEASGIYLKAKSPNTDMEWDIVTTSEYGTNNTFGKAELPEENKDKGDKN